MFLRRTVPHLLSIVGLVLGLGHAAAQTTFSTVVVFGDSLSDTGNVAHVVADANPLGIRYPADNTTLGFDYTDGRFTDGKDTQPAAQAYFGVWIEQLAASLAAKPAVKNSLDGGTNYAYGDALTANGTRTVTEGPISVTLENMGQQVTDYLNSGAAAPNAKTLMVLWGGSNDVLDAAGAGADPVAAATSAVANELALVQRLIAAGATSFMLPDLPPLGGLPQAAGTSAATALNNASGAFKAALVQGIATLTANAKAGGVTLNFYQPDVLTAFATVAAHPNSVGLSNVSTAAQNITGSPDTYLIWDGLHPTTTGHHYVAAIAANLLTPLVASSTAATVPAAALPGQTVTLSAKVSSTVTTVTATPTGSMTFFNGSTLLGSSPLDATGTGTATFVASAAASPYSITAVYVGDTTYSLSAAAAQPLAVLAAPITTTTSLSSSNLNADLNSSVTFTATVTPSVTTDGTPSGTVTFFDGSTNLGTGAVTAGKATFATSTLTAGPHSITAVYAANGIFGGSSAAAISQVIVAPSFTVSVTPSPFTIPYGGTAVAGATVTSLGGYSGTFTLACGTLPAHLSCSFGTTTVTVAADSSQGSTLTIAANSSSSAALAVPARPGSRMGAPVLSATLLFPGLAGALLFSLRRRRGLLAAMGKSALCLLLLVGATYGLSGCGSNSSSGNNAPRGTYTVPVTFTPATGTAQTVNVTVVVQ